MLIDSLPIVLAKNSRSSKANVARELADKGYCSSKKMFYYGVKLHVIGTVRTGTLPLPLVVGLTQASCHDLKAFSPIVKNFRDAEFFGDKAYCDCDLQTELKALNNVILITPIKKKKGQIFLDSTDRLYSRSVSSIRQPIESFFNWIQEKTNIQVASKVRSKKGLLIHVFAKLAAGLMMIKV